MRIHSKGNALILRFIPVSFWLGFFFWVGCLVGFFPQLRSDCHVFFCIYPFQNEHMPLMQIGDILTGC